MAFLLDSGLTLFWRELDGNEGGRCGGTDFFFSCSSECSASLGRFPYRCRRFPFHGTARNAAPASALYLVHPVLLPLSMTRPCWELSSSQVLLLQMVAAASAEHTPSRVSTLPYSEFHLSVPRPAALFPSMSAARIVMCLSQDSLRLRRLSSSASRTTVTKVTDFECEDSDIEVIESRAAACKTLVQLNLHGNQWRYTGMDWEIEN
ncbi:hypothetical protein C8R44DRAFT_233162 [Mycena epipterygia]|nr:hypothetical protein C8R44DRAFT_233162 [Mycena epipterygia]